MNISIFSRGFLKNIIRPGKINASSAKQTILGLTMLSALSIGSAHAAAINFSNSNFTTLTPTGNLFTGGTNDVVGSWDGTYNTSANGAGSTDFNLNLASASSNPFFSFLWTIHHARVFGPGSWIFNVDCTAAQLDAGACAPNIDPSRNLSLTVNPGQIGVHMLFDWNTFTNVDIANVWDLNSVFGPSPMWAGYAGSNSADRIWDFMSADGNGDGINGIPMIDGPFVNYNFNFNLGTAVVPLPSAVWLFGSGLAGLIAFARRRAAR